MRYLLFLSLAFAINLSQAQRITKPECIFMLSSENWKLRQENSHEIFKAKVPGCVQSDLMANKQIGNLILDTNEQQFKWVEDKNWVYSCEFESPKNWFKSEVINLVFEGIDTYSEIYLNNKLVCSTNNMFLKYELEIKSLLKVGKNTLTVKIKSPIATALPLLKSTKYRLPAGNDRNEFQTSVFTRKAPFQYGWDWGPRIVTMGIWKPVYIELKNFSQIKDISVITDSITSDYAIISISPEYTIPFKNDYFLELKLEDFYQQIPLNQSKDLLPIKVKIKNPKLWYPNGYGTQPIYNLEITLKSKSEILDKKNINFGIRTIKLIQEEDSIGSSFYFNVNGIPIFIKGANYIPQDNFLSSVDTSRYIRLIQLAKDANMNMLRVWGGGIYESDLFYNLCDKAGILVWQDFMFACSLYPGDSLFLESVKKEAEQNVKRLRNHPSLALWCGNNEMNELWYNWGYQKAYGYSTSDSIEIWNNYLNVFHEIIPNVLKSYDLKRPYIPSSPLFGWGNTKSMKYGDSHYWGVWWGKEPFEMYATKVPRFSSEYGFQSLPQMSTIQAMSSNSIESVNNFAIQNHQKHSEGFQIIKQYIEREFTYSDSLNELIYLSQLTQKLGIGMAIKAHRLARNNCMGTIYWQLNDCWPSISWSSTDYYGNPKLLWYETKNLFTTFMVSSAFENNKIEIAVVSDSIHQIKPTLELKFYNFDGTIIYTTSEEIKLLPLQSFIKSAPILDSILQNNDLSKVFIETKLVLDGRTLSSELKFLKPSKELRLPEAKIEAKAWQSNNLIILDIASKTLTKDIMLEINSNGYWSENGFTMKAGEKKRIVFTNYEQMNENAIVNIMHLSDKGVKNTELNVTKP